MQGTFGGWGEPRHSKSRPHQQRRGEREGGWKGEGQGYPSPHPTRAVSDVGVRITGLRSARWGRFAMLAVSPGICKRIAPRRGYPLKARARVRGRANPNEGAKGREVQVGFW